MSRRHVSALAFVVSTLLLAACAGGDDNLTLPEPAFALAVAPSNVTIQAGGTATITASIARAGFGGAVTVVAENLPAGVSAGAAAIAAGADAGTITLNAAPTAVAVTASLTIRATGAGVQAKTATVQLTVTAAPVSGIALAGVPTALSIQQGQSGSATLTISRSSFFGAVALTSTGAPAGMTVTFSPASVSGTTSTITVAVAGAVAAGSYPVTVQGSGTGIPNASTILGVTVTAPAGSIALSAAPASLTIQQGQSGTSQLAIARTNFIGAVNLTSSGTPAGMTATLSPATASGTSAAVTIAVGASVPIGTYQLSIQGTGAGVPNATVGLSVTVTAPGGTGNVTWTFCAQSGLPIWFAFSDNGGAFTKVTSSTGVFNFTVGQKGRVAWVMQDGAKTRLELYYGSLQDLNLRGRSFCRGNGSTKTISGSVLGLGATERASMSMGAGFATVMGSGANTFQLANVQDGLLDLIGVRQTAASVTNSIVIQRDRNDANGANVPVDFGSGVAPVTRTATIANLGSDNASMIASLLSKNGTVANLFFSVPGTALTRTWTSAPDASIISGDWHMQTVVATPAMSTNGFPYRSLLFFTRFGVDRTLTLPAMLTTAPTVSVQSTVPYVTLTSFWLVQSAEYNDFWSLTYTPASGNVSSVFVSGTVGYFGGGPVRLDIPAFDASFNPLQTLQPGIPVSLSFFAAGGTAWGPLSGHAALPNEGEFATTGGILGATFTP